MNSLEARLREKQSCEKKGAKQRFGPGADCKPIFPSRSNLVFSQVRFFRNLFFFFLFASALRASAGVQKFFFNDGILKRTTSLRTVSIF